MLPPRFLGPGRAPSAFVLASQGHCPDELDLNVTGVQPAGRPGTLSRHRACPSSGTGVLVGVPTTPGPCEPTPSTCRAASTPSRLAEARPRLQHRRRAGPSSQAPLGHSCPRPPCSLHSPPSLVSPPPTSVPPPGPSVRPQGTAGAARSLFCWTLLGGCSLVYPPPPRIWLVE